MKVVQFYQVLQKMESSGCWKAWGAALTLEFVLELQLMPAFDAHLLDEHAHRKIIIFLSRQGNWSHRNCQGVNVLEGPRP